MRNIVKKSVDIYNQGNNFMKKYSNEILLLGFSVILILILSRYSQEPGFILENNNGDIYYSTQLMSSGGDDFDVFIGWNLILNIFIGFISIINIIINIFEKKERHFSYVIYFISFLLLGLLLFSINLDIPFVLIIVNKDKYFILWLIFFAIEFIIININRIIIKKIINVMDIILLKK